MVDGNVIRVLSRLRAIADDPKKSTTVKLHWALAGQLVHAERPGDFNQVKGVSCIGGKKVFECVGKDLGF